MKPLALFARHSPAAICLLVGLALNGCASTGSTKPPAEPWKPVPIETHAASRSCVDPYRPNATQRPLQRSAITREAALIAQLANTADILAIALSGDGRALLSGDTDGNIVVRDRASGAHVRSIYAPAGVRAFAAIPSTPLVFAATTDCRISLWDIRTGRLIESASQIDGAVDHLAVVKSAQGSHIVAAATQVELTVWTFGGGDPRQLLRLPIDRIEGVSASSDGALVAVAAHDPTVRLVDIEKLTVTAVPLRAGIARSDVKFQGSQAIQVIDADGEVATIDLLDRQRRVTCRIGDRVEFIHDSDGVVPVGVWRQTAAGGRQLAAAFTSGTSREVFLWDLQGCRRLLVADWHEGGYGYIPPNPVVLLPDGTEFMYADGRTIVVVDADTGAKGDVLRGQSEPVDFVRATGDGSIVALEGLSQATVLDWGRSSVSVRPIQRPLIGGLPKDSRVPRNAVALVADQDGAPMLITAHAVFSRGTKPGDDKERSRITLTAYNHARRAERAICANAFDETGELGSFLISPDGTTAAFFMIQTAGENSWRHWISVYSLQTCKRTRQLDASMQTGNLGYLSGISHALLSADGALMVTAWYGDPNPRVHTLRADVPGCKAPDPVDLVPTVATLPVIGNSAYGVRSLSLSADYVIAGHDSGDTNIWNIGSLARSPCRWPKQLNAHWSLAGSGWSVRGVALETRSMTAAFGDEDGLLRVVALEGGQERQSTLRFPSPVRQLHFFDERYMLVATADGAATVLDRRRIAPAEPTPGVLKSPGDTVAMRSDIHVPTGRRSPADVSQAHVISLVTTGDGNWAATTLEGRFDTNDVEGMSGLRWVMSDDPMRALPLEIFMREYYEPRLMERLRTCRGDEDSAAVSGACSKEFGRVRTLIDINRAQPAVTEITVTPHGAGNESVDVTLTIEAEARSFAQGSDSKLWNSGAYDLRVFRNGQLVGQIPDSLDPAPLRSTDVEQELARWSSTSEIVKGAGRRTVTLRDVRLPRRPDVGPIEFSAYAFNAHKVKGPTRRVTYTPPVSATGAIKRRAYVVAVGVSAFTDPAWDLHYADNDARKVIEVLAPRLKGLGQYDEVVAIPLLASWSDASGVRTVTARTATKDNIRRVLDVLAGRAPPVTSDGAIPNESMLRRAGPDDLVVIAFSSHGYVDRFGNYFVFPFDIGTSAAANEDTVRRAISSSELAAWLRDVDAGDLVMIIDACHSAAGVAIPGFKPGPMGSRGLGQLAYDKGMRVLASTRADDLAWEAEDKQQGLLSFALVHDGLELGLADFRPRDGVIGVGEWLSYAVWRVPGLYKDKDGQQGDMTTKAPRLTVFDAKSRKSRPFEVGDAKVDPAGQRPDVFDFRRGPDLPIAIRSPAASDASTR